MLQYDPIPAHTEKLQQLYLKKMFLNYKLDSIRPPIKGSHFI